MELTNSRITIKCPNCNCTIFKIKTKLFLDKENDELELTCNECGFIQHKKIEQKGG